MSIVVILKNCKIINKKEILIIYFLKKYINYKNIDIKDNFFFFKYK